MTTITNATSSPALQPAATPQTRPGAGASDVGSTGNAASSNATGSAGSAGSAATAATAANTAGSSSVTSLSSISNQLQAAKVAAGDSVFSTDKVNEIKAAISQGTFKVDSHKVASALLDSVQGLLGSRQNS